MNKQALRADILLLITAGLWGFAFVAQSAGMDHVGPFTYNGLRFPLGSLFLLPVIIFLKAKGRLSADVSLKKGDQIRITLITGAVLFIAVGLQQIGMIFTTVGNAGFITGFYVVLTPVFGILIGRKTGLPTWFGMVFAIIGFYFIFAAGSGLSSVNPGDLIMILSAAFWAVHVLTIDHFVKKINPLILAAGQFAWCGFFALIAAFAIEPFVGAWAMRIAPDFAVQEWATLLELIQLAAAGTGTSGSNTFSSIAAGAAVPVLFGGLASVGIAYTLQVIAQKDAPPAHATIILSMEGCFAVLGGILLRNEEPGSFTLLGFLFMLLAMVITQWDVIVRKEK